MENRLKERLTGAAILVALIVLLVPEMFRGQRAELAASAGGSAEGPPVRSYTIDLSNTTTGSAPMRSSTAEVASGTDSTAADPSNTASKPPVQAGVAASASSRVPVSAPALPSVTALPSTSALPKVTASSKAAPSPKVIPSPKLTPSPKATSPARVVASANLTTHVERPHADAPAEPRTSEGDNQGTQSGWGVQLGLFAQRENAERLVRAAQQKGFAVRISQPDAKGRYRVHVAGLADRAAAQNLLLRLKAQGLAASVVAPQ